MAIHTDLDKHMTRVFGAGNFSTSGNSATLPTQAASHQRLEELLDVAFQIKHDVKLVAGVLTIAPR